MKYLLDTHSLIWFINGDTQLSSTARKLIEDEDNELFISIASLWEMAIKFSLHKLNISKVGDLSEYRD
jgi:PIN domain nuclease of toxin-antitoxin system